MQLISRWPLIVLVTFHFVSRVHVVQDLRPRETKSTMCPERYAMVLEAAARQTSLDPAKIVHTNVPDSVDDHCIFFVSQKTSYGSALLICNATGGGNIAVVTGRALKCLQQVGHFLDKHVFVRTVHAEPVDLMQEYKKSRHGCDSQTLKSRRNNNKELQSFPAVVHMTADKTLHVTKTSEREAQGNYFLCALPRPNSLQKAAGLRVVRAATKANVSESTPAEVSKEVKRAIDPSQATETRAGGDSLKLVIAVVGGLGLLLMVFVVLLVAMIMVVRRGKNQSAISAVDNKKKIRDKASSSGVKKAVQDPAALAAPSIKTPETPSPPPTPPDNAAAARPPSRTAKSAARSQVASAVPVRSFSRTPASHTAAMPAYPFSPTGYPFSPNPASLTAPMLVYNPFCPSPYSFSAAAYPFPPASATANESYYSLRDAEGIVDDDNINAPGTNDPHKRKDPISSRQLYTCKEDATLKGIPKIPNLEVIGGKTIVFDSPTEPRRSAVSSADDRHHEKRER